MISVLLGLMAKVILLVLLGYWMKRRGFISEQFERELSNLLVKVIFPISVIASADNEFSMDKVYNILTIAAVAALYYVGAIVISTLVGRGIGLPAKDRNIYMTMTTFANTGFIGIPVALELYGSEGMLYAVVYNIFYQLFFFTYGIAMLGGDGKFHLKDAWNPCVWSALAAIAIFLLPFSLPWWLQDTVETVGNMVVPLSMMIIGFGMTDIRFHEILSDIRAYYVSALRLLVLPALVFLGCRAAGIGSELTMIAAIMSGVPSGSMNVIMAKQYDCDTEYATMAVLQTMLFGVVTLPLLVAVGNRLI